jgi:hypothetical protein
MSLTEKVLKCINCRKQFTFTVAQQEFQISRGYPNNPGLCPACRRARKTYRAPDESGVGIKVRSSNFLR